MIDAGELVLKYDVFAERGESRDRSFGTDDVKQCLSGQDVV